MSETSEDRKKILREEIARVCHICYSRGFVAGAGGNVSARLPESDLILITATGVSLRDAGPEDIVAIGLDGSLREGQKKPSKEVPFHTEIYRRRPDIHAVLHLHPPFATTFAVLRRPLPMVTITAEVILKEVPLVPRAPSGTRELGELVGRYVEEHPSAKAFLLADHGIVAMGPDLTGALNIADLVEDTAKVAWLTQIFKSQG
ncbi:MAG: class II aldolase/adducin family protein [Armatimonadota bacterium]|nr:class II aldolase/adducin family protein [Armatimonadota bacterium]MDR5703276.1 class II aldolase/adducin family protein [Armatimonadota bacterium]MDR7435278.1 class II aldolase/adducin family protein [Armatimonadota bacterium]